MKHSLVLAVSVGFFAAGALLAQPPDFPGGRGRRAGGDLVAASVTRMMSFDADGDGKLSKSEVTDPRLAPLFARADDDKDGTVTKDELTGLFTRESPLRAGDRNPRDGGPPGGFGDAFAPPGPPGARPRPGEVLPRFLRDELQLSRRQRSQLDRLQSDVDERLARILTEEQLGQLAQIRQRGPGPFPPDGPPHGQPRSDRRPRDDR